MTRRGHLHSIEGDSPKIATPAPRLAAEDRGHGFIPRGLRREAAAFYVGVSTAKFDDWVARGLMPGPKEERGVVVWDRRALDDSFEALPDRAPKKKDDPYGEVAT